MSPCLQGIEASGVVLKQLSHARKPHKFLELFFEKYLNLASYLWTCKGEILNLKY